MKTGAQYELARSLTYLFIFLGGVRTFFFTFKIHYHCESEIYYVFNRAGSSRFVSTADRKLTETFTNLSVKQPILLINVTAPLLLLHIILLP